MESVQFMPPRPKPASSERPCFRLVQGLGLGVWGLGLGFGSAQTACFRVWWFWVFEAPNFWFRAKGLGFRV